MGFETVLVLSAAMGRTRELPLLLLLFFFVFKKKIRAIDLLLTL